MKNHRTGFSLLEIVLVLFVLGILATALVPSVKDVVEKGRTDAEKKSLDELVATITASFEATDLTNLNVAALPGTIGAGDVPTEFSTTSAGNYATTNTGSWFAKVARLRGLTPMVGTAPSVSAQPALAQITYNAFGAPRMLFQGPTESGQQRFLLVSLMSPTGQLMIPAWDGTAAWFDAIWNNDWESRTAAIPALWTGLLTPAQRAAWNQGSAGLTQAYHLCVRRIVLPKYVVTVNNNHPTNAAFLSFNNQPNAFSAPANSGANVSSEILGGRLVTVNQGPVWPGTEALRFYLHENPTVTIQ